MRNQVYSYQIISAGGHVFDPDRMILVVKGNVNVTGKKVKILAAPGQPEITVLRSEPIGTYQGEGLTNTIVSVIHSLSGTKTVLELPLPSGWYRHDGTQNDNWAGSVDWGALTGDFNMAALDGTMIQRTIGTLAYGGKSGAGQSGIVNTDTDSGPIVFDTDGEPLSNGMTGTDTPISDSGNTKSIAGMEWKTWYWIPVVILLYLGYRKLSK